MALCTATCFDSQGTPSSNSQKTSKTHQFFMLYNYFTLRNMAALTAYAKILRWKLKQGI